MSFQLCELRSINDAGRAVLILLVTEPKAEIDDVMIRPIESMLALSGTGET